MFTSTCAARTDLRQRTALLVQLHQPLHDDRTQQLALRQTEELHAAPERPDQDAAAQDDVIEGALERVCDGRLRELAVEQDEVRVACRGACADDALVFARLRQRHLAAYDLDLFGEVGENAKRLVRIKVVADLERVALLSEGYSDNVTHHHHRVVAQCDEQVRRLGVLRHVTAHEVRLRV